MPIPISDKDLIKAAIRNARARALGKSQRWVAVKDTFALGSTYAYELCRDYGFNPDEEVWGPTCERCEQEAEENEDDIRQLPPDEVLIKHDGRPLLYTCVAESGLKYLGTLACEDESAEVWVYAPISHYTLENIKAGITELRWPFISVMQGQSFQVVTVLKDGKINQHKLYSLPERLIPDAGVRLRVAPSAEPVEVTNEDDGDRRGITFANCEDY